MEKCDPQGTEGPMRPVPAPVLPVVTPAQQRAYEVALREEGILEQWGVTEADRYALADLSAKVAQASLDADAATTQTYAVVVGHTSRWELPSVPYEACYRAEEAKPGVEGCH